MNKKELSILAVVLFLLSFFTLPVYSSWTEYADIKYIDLDGDASDEIIIESHHGAGSNHYIEDLRIYKDAYPELKLIFHIRTLDRYFGNFVDFIPQDTISEVKFSNQNPKDGTRDIIVKSKRFYYKDPECKILNKEEDLGHKVYKWNGDVFIGTDTYVYTTEDNNIYLIDKKGNKMQLTFESEDYEPKLSPNGQQVIFIRYITKCPITPDTGWLPADYDEIWSMNVDGSNKKCMVKNNYSAKQDMNNYLGSFGSLHFSPNGKKIYFLCQNCVTDALLYTANADGSDVRKVTNAHQLDIIGGSPKDEYYGYLVAGKRKSSNEKINWTLVLLDPEGTEIKEIDDPDDFWLNHTKAIF